MSLRRAVTVGCMGPMPVLSAMPLEGGQWEAVDCAPTSSPPQTRWQSVLTAIESGESKTAWEWCVRGDCQRSRARAQSPLAGPDKWRAGCGVIPVYRELESGGRVADRVVAKLVQAYGTPLYRTYPASTLPPGFLPRRLDSGPCESCRSAI